MDIILFLLSSLFPFLYKYTLVTTNQYTQIPIILSFLDKNYLINDWYVSASQSFGPRTFFAYYMAITARFFSLPEAFFVNYVFYIFLISFSTFRLSQILYKNRYVSFLAVITVLFAPSYSLGGNILITKDFSAPQLPMGLLLLGIVSLIEKKFLRSVFSFSLASYLHPHIGIIGGSISYLVYYCSQPLFLNKKINKFNFAKYLKIFLLYIFLISPLFFLYLPELDPEFLKIHKNNLIDIIVYMRAPHHYLPSSWPKDQFFLFLFFVMTAAYFIFKLKIDNYLRNYLIYLTIFILFLCILAYFFTEILPVYQIVILQFYRFTLIISWLGLTILSGSIYKMVLLNNKNKFLLLIPFFFVIAKNFSLSKVSILSITLLFLLIIFCRRVSILVFITGFTTALTLQHYHAKLNIASLIGHPTVETSLALWAKTNTPKKSIFLIPVEFEKFRTVSQRAVIADWKAFPFQKRAIIEWGERICQISNQKNCNFRNMSLQKAIRGYYDMSLIDIKNLQEKYAFDYFISYATLPIPVTYHEGNYFIYKWPEESNQKEP